MLEDKNYQEGGADGALDAADGKSKRYVLRPLQYILKQPLSLLLPGGSDRFSEYWRSYNTSFEDGTRVRNLMKHIPLTAPAVTAGVALSDASLHQISQHSGGEGMSQATSYARQIELLSHLRQSLIQCQEDMWNNALNYQKAVEYLHGEGMMDETHRDFVANLLEPTCALIRQLVDHIGENDIPAVDREIAFLDQKL